MEEILDIIDEEDNVIGQATRKECHSNPNIMHRTVQFAVVDDINGMVLLTTRSIKKSHDGGKITFLGEHILSGEGYEEALKRGAREELGINAERFKEISMKIFPDVAQKELVKFFLIFYTKGDINCDPEEIDDYKWVSIKDIKGWKDKVSDMTRYWIENTDWEKVL
jgi:isopentenyldiphosphate isomerase